MGKKRCKHLWFLQNDKNFTKNKEIYVKVPKYSFNLLGLML